VPAYAVSGVLCPACFDEESWSDGAPIYVAGNKTQFPFRGLAISTAACVGTGFNPGFTATSFSGLLTMSSGASYTGLIGGAGPTSLTGTLGAPLVVPGPLVFNNVTIPNGPPPPLIRPTKLTLDFDVLLTPTGGGSPITCHQTLTWDLQTTYSGLALVFFGTGNFNWTINATDGTP